jgi:hypothetical protein
MIIRKAMLVFLVFFCALVLTACSGNNMAIIEDTTCGSHCWRNIVLGETNPDQAVQLLQQMPDMDLQTIRQIQKSQENEDIVRAGFQGAREGWMEITFLEGKAAVIHFYFQEDIPLGAIIRKFGEPKYVWPQATQGDPFTRLTTYFFYPEDRICLFHEYSGFVTGKPKTSLVTRSTKIGEIWFVDPSISPSQLDNSCLVVEQKMDSGLVGQKWEGYKAYPIP